MTNDQADELVTVTLRAARERVAEALEELDVMAVYMEDGNRNAALGGMDLLEKPLDQARALIEAMRAAHQAASLGD